MKNAYTIVSSFILLQKENLSFSIPSCIFMEKEIVILPKSITSGDLQKNYLNGYLTV